MAETDVTPREYNFSVGYFMRKVLLNPYLFSVVHDEDEIDPEVLTSKNDFIPGNPAVAYDEIQLSIFSSTEMTELKCNGSVRP